MVRAAAKNFQNTAVVVERNDYLPVTRELVESGDLPLEKRRKLAQKAFSYTSFYDSLIAGFMSADFGSESFKSISGRHFMNPRYGENPHQKAAMFLQDRQSPFWKMEQLQGKELSFNNLLDLSSVYEILSSFKDDEHFSVIVKHQNPCGAAVRSSQAESFQLALAGDPLAAYGGIVGVNQPLGESAALAMKEIFFEVILAPDFTPAAREILSRKKNLRLIAMPLGYVEKSDVKIIPGGFLYQERDNALVPFSQFVSKTSRPLGADEQRDVEFGWKLIKFVKSNAIAVVKNGMLLGAGAGQQSRIDAVRIALEKSRSDLHGAVLVSDAYFPFADSIEMAAEKGITVAVEPGGSIRDEEVIAAAEKLGLSLLFTGMRHFRH